MLYDPKWEGQTKTDPFTLAGFIEWLEKQPAKGTYDWPDIHGCLLCMYLRNVTGLEKPAQDMSGGIGPHSIKDWGDYGYYAICQELPWTFGAALDRARAWSGSK